MQSEPIPLSDRSNLSADVARRIRDLIATGELPPNSRINEVHLSRELGVSRTPLREALASLIAEGAIKHQPRRGNFVRPLTRDEFESIYGIRPILDIEALRLSGIPDEATIERLESLNEKLRTAKSTAKRIELDDEWHLLLVENCGNSVLLDLIRQFINRTRRYEVAYLKDAEHVGTAYDEHVVVMNALRAGDLDAACKGLTQNLTTGIDPILEWLDSLEEQRQ
ncbi:MAG: GntR family transcriptional regulator [Pseudomonadota bacterium]